MGLVQQNLLIKSQKLNRLRGYMMIEYIKKEFTNSISIKQALLQDIKFIDTLSTIGEACIRTYNMNNKIMICGNGGSAGDAMHFVGELVGRYRRERTGLNAICLNTNEINMTAIANDYGYNDVFSRQVVACGKSGDIFFGISTSGNSQNINKAFEEARKIGIKTVGLLGRDGGESKLLCDYPIIVPCNTTSHIQEVHILILHILAGIVEEGLFKNK